MNNEKTCPICGKMRLGLTNHLRDKHQVRREQTRRGLVLKQIQPDGSLTTYPWWRLA